MKTWIVYVDGTPLCYVNTVSMSIAEKRARKKFAGQNIQVVYTKI